MKKPSFSLSACLHNRKVMVAVSIVLAVVLWYLVMSGPANIQERELSVPVSVDLSNSYAETIGLRLTTEASTDITVVVRGQWSVISRLTPADLRVRANVSSVQKAGTQDVPITANYNSSLVNYDIVSIHPNSLSISCDYWETEEFRVQVDTSSLSAAEGMQLGTPILDPAVTTDGSLTLSGPKTSLDRIRTLVARISESETLSDVRNFEASLTALDEMGAEVSMDGCTVQGTSLKSISVTVPVWVVREVPLSCKLKNAPAFFEGTSQRITVTPNTLRLLGPVNTLDTRTDLGVVGTLDFDTLSLETATREIVLSLPDPVQAVGGETTVELQVDLQGFDQKTILFVPQADNVSYLNLPAGRKAAVQQRSWNVCLVGRAESIRSITEEDLRLAVDLSGAPTGTASYSARLRVEGYDDVWVYYGEAASGMTAYVTVN